MNTFNYWQNRQNSSLTEKEKSNWFGKFMPKFNLGKYQEYKEHMKIISGLYIIKKSFFYFNDL